MHTAQQLDASYFEAEIMGKSAPVAEVFPRWNTSDRLGIIVTSPMGAIGASLLLQLSITAFYDAAPNRRQLPLYPEVHIFHVGKMHGDHMFYDVFPARKEVLVPSDPSLILEEINNRAITRLAVVDGPITPVEHFYKEPASARDRVISAYVYSPNGRVREPDVSLTAVNKRAVTNTRMALTATTSYSDYVANAAASDKEELASGVPKLSAGEKLQPQLGREQEVSDADKATMASCRLDISNDGLPTETYRRVPVDDALHMLTNGYVGT